MLLPLWEAVQKEVYMKKDNARMLVIGAGVNGSICASRLYDAGFDVTVLARSQRYEEIRYAGIVIEDPMTMKRSVTRVPVINALDPQDSYDYILVVVRKNQVAALLPVLARNVSRNIVFMGNNLSDPGNILPSWVRSGSCWGSCSLQEEGKVTLFAPGLLEG
jgi:ketopantoate reductase